MVRLRAARVCDAQDVARIYVEGWRNAYPGLLPDSLLVGMRADERRGRAWARLIARSGSSERVIVAETIGGGSAKVVGFASGGAAREDGLGHDGEVNTLYVDDDFRGNGIGRRLFATMAVGLAERHGPSVMVWVLEGNPARYFYESLDGRLVGRRPGSLGGADIVELAYAWPQASVLAALQG